MTKPKNLKGIDPAKLKEVANLYDIASINLVGMIPSGHARRRKDLQEVQAMATEIRIWFRDALAQVSDRGEDPAEDPVTDYPCKHGHYDCATEEGGPCWHEALRATRRAEYEAGVVKKMAYELGESVSVVSFGSWYQGTVVKLGRTKVHVEYTTGSGTTRTKSFDPSGERITKDLTKSGKLPFKRPGARGRRG